VENLRAVGLLAQGNVSREIPLQLVEAMKTQKPSISYKHVKNNLLEHGNLPGGTSISAVGHAVQNLMSEGVWTWKRMCRSIKNKFYEANVNYSQDYLNFISQIDPYRLKFFDEMGVSLYDSNKRYGHSLKNTPCVEVGRFTNSPNMTVNLLAGLDGVMYVNTVDGASATVEFFNFFGEASRCFQENGNPVLMAGDIIVLDNCATHHNAGGFALGELLDDMGFDVVYLPTYSPEMNRVELVFQKLKIILKREEFEPRKR
jgi:transposase